MKQAEYLAFDLETGGIAEGCSILTGCFIALDEDVNIVGRLDLAVKPDDSAPYVVTAQGLAVNQINIIEHDKVAISQSKAGGELHAFIKLHSQNGKVKLIPIGHNVAGDIKWVDQNLLKKKHWDQYVSYRTLDTGCIGQFFKFCGIIPKSTAGSLTHLADFFGINFLERAHTAESDTMVCVDILKKAREFVLNAIRNSVEIV